MGDRQPRRRTSSLRITTRPVQVPIPPSLLTSPYLTSPESIFQREIATPYLPSEADEEWLQDTVPLDAGETDTINGSEVRKEEKSILRRRSSPHLHDYDCIRGHRGGWDRDYDSKLNSPMLASSAPPSAAIRPCVHPVVGLAGNVMSPPSTSTLPSTVTPCQSTDRTPVTETLWRFPPDNAIALNLLDSPPRPFVGHRKAHPDVSRTHSEFRG